MVRAHICMIHFLCDCRRTIQRTERTTTRTRVSGLPYSVTFSVPAIFVWVSRYSSYIEPSLILVFIRQAIRQTSVRASASCTWTADDTRWRSIPCDAPLPHPSAPTLPPLVLTCYIRTRTSVLGVLCRRAPPHTCIGTPSGTPASHVVTLCMLATHTERERERERERESVSSG